MKLHVLSSNLFNLLLSSSRREGLPRAARVQTMPAPCHMGHRHLALHSFRIAYSAMAISGVLIITDETTREAPEGPGYLLVFS